MNFEGLISAVPPGRFLLIKQPDTACLANFLEPLRGGKIYTYHKVFADG